MTLRHPGKGNAGTSERWKWQESSAVLLAALGRNSHATLTEVSLQERESLGIDLLPLKKKQLPHKHAKQSPDEPEKPWMPVHPRITKETEESQKQTLVSLYHNQCLKNQMLQIRPTNLLVWTAALRLSEAEEYFSQVCNGLEVSLNLRWSQSSWYLNLWHQVEQSFPQSNSV